MFGSRYHNRVKIDKILLQTCFLPETSLSVKPDALFVIFFFPESGKMCFICKKLVT